MAAGGVPRDVRSFIEAHLHSLDQLEVLLLLERERERWWTADAVAEELGTSSRSAAMRLEELSTRNFLDARTAETVLFRYSPTSPELDRGVKSLARAYEDRRVAVTTLIFSRSTEAMRAFAEAFRLRRDEEEGNDE